MLSAVERLKSNPTAFRVPRCSPVRGSRPSAMRLFRSLKSPGPPVAIELLSRSLVIETDKEVCWPARYVSVALPPLTTDWYAGVYVYHCCASAPAERCGRNTYGCVKSTRRPRL